MFNLSRAQQINNAHECTEGEHLIEERMVPVLKALFSNAAMRVLLLPVNCFTYPMTKKIVDLCRQMQGGYNDFSKKLGQAGADSTQPLTVIATDLFRAHPRRPGLYSCEDIVTLPTLEVAVASLKRSLDTCLTLEKKFLEEVRTRHVLIKLILLLFYITGIFTFIRRHCEPQSCMSRSSY